MKKLFNKKIMKVYIALICLTLIAGSVSLGFSISLSSKLQIAIEESEKQAAGDETSEAVLNFITSAVSALSGEKTGSNKSSSWVDKRTLNDEGKEIYNKRVVAIVSTVIMYVLTALFTVGTITCVKYEQYLLSDKYKAKLKRMKKYENCYNT